MICALSCATKPAIFSANKRFFSRPAKAAFKISAGAALYRPLPLRLKYMGALCSLSATAAASSAVGLRP